LPTVIGWHTGFVRSDVSGADGLLNRVGGHQAPPSVQLVLWSGALAALLVMNPAWRYSRHVGTLTHEAAHGVAALLSGRALAGIRLHSDTSGLTLSRGRARGPGMVATAAAGYLGSSALGLAATLVLVAGRTVGLLWLMVGLLALLLLQIRNWFGLWSVAVVGAATFSISWWGDTLLQSGFAYTATWFLLLSAPRPVFELQASRRRGQARGSDVDTLARLTHLPGLLWVALFAVLTVLSAAAGGYLLFGHAV
jgi:hypothetical protein